MASFLQLLAKDIIRKYGTDFADLTIIFPNKRAGLFLAEELSRQIDRPVWMPDPDLDRIHRKAFGTEKSRNTFFNYQTLQILYGRIRLFREIRRFLFLGKYATG